MLANLKGQDLKVHLMVVADMAKAMGRRIGLPKDLLDVIHTSGLLHDIGKVIRVFQKHMNRCIEANEVLIIDNDFQDPLKDDYPMHHEISWAFLTGKICNEGILNAVYWHHARPIHDTKKKTYDDADEILGMLNAKDLDALEKMWDELLEMVPDKFIGFFGRGTPGVPDLFVRDGSSNRNDNAEFMLVRSCVIASDRYISSLSSSGINLSAIQIDEIISSMVRGNIQGNVSCPEVYDAKRFELQVGIVSDIGDERTSIVKAPAGLGKTMIGLLWSQLRKGKVLWVCPRNVVADAVYENLKKEIEILGMSCTIELYRTGSRQRTNVDDGRPEFDSDIIVTNIDAIMSPMVNNSVAGRLFTIYGSHVVLDEFHEFVSDAPLFAAFVTFMRARHRVADHCKTLLLSATPSLVHVLWDTSERKTLILPNESEHYIPQHEGSYKVSFSNDFPLRASPGDLLVCNSVSEAQGNFKDGGYTLVIHHRYTEKDRIQKDALIKSFFSKGGGGIKTESLSAALVVQAAMDISFIHLYDSVCSPESSMQRVGRTDRWGDYQTYFPEVTFMDLSDEKTEGAAIRTVYNKYLQKKWYAFLKNAICDFSEVDLRTLYKIYNKFYHSYRSDMIEYLKEQYRVGMHGYKAGMEFLGLIGFYPLKVLNSDPEMKKKKQHKNLRNPDGSYFYTVEILGKPNEWLSPEDVLSEGYELHDRYEKNYKLTLELLNSGAMLTRLKGLVACGYTGWRRQSKGVVPTNMKAWFYKARDPETPLPDFSRKYDSVLGVVKI